MIAKASGYVPSFLNDAAEDGLRNIPYLEYQCVYGSEEMLKAVTPSP